MIIALNGKIGSGKSTVAKQLSLELNDIHGITTVIKSFSTPIYQMVSAMFQEEVEAIKNNKNTIVRPRSFSETRTYRQLLQCLGMGFRDSVHEDIWIDALFGRDYNKIIRQFNVGIDCWIIDDLRFINEFEKIKQLNGYVIKLHRELPDIQQELYKEIFEDKSETDFDNTPDSDWDLVLDNNNSLDYAIAAIINLVINDI